MSDTMFDAMFGAAIAGGGSSGGFTPTEQQLTAMNSGIDSTKVAQIETNKNNILSKCVYCTCNTAGSTAEKVINAPSGWILQDGCIIGIKNTNSNTANNVTLNVNNTGAKSIAYGSNTPYTGRATKVTGLGNHVTYYMYDGTYWCYITTNRIESEMPQSEATAGTSTEARLITAKVLSDTIDEKLAPILAALQSNNSKALSELKNGVEMRLATKGIETDEETESIER